MMRKIKALVAAAAVMMPLAAQAWQRQAVTDALEGVTGVGVRAFGTAEVSGRTHAAALIVNCEKNSTTVVFSHDGFVHFSRPAMRFRLDDKPVQNAPGVGPSMNNHYVGWWNGAGIPFAKSLYGAKQLKVDILDHLMGEQTVFTFNVEGAQEGLAEAAAACKWGK
jgi:hypothetical protein